MKGRGWGAGTGKEEVEEEDGGRDGVEDRKSELWTWNRSVFGFLFFVSCFCFCFRLCLFLVFVYRTFVVVILY